MENYMMEIFFFNSIKSECEVIFDVGAQQSIYLNEPIDVHYFEPLASELEILKSTHTNKKGFFNCFGLGEREEYLKYYDYGAFFDRSASGVNGMVIAEFPIKRGDDYINEHDIQRIDFLKIDVEGFELSVLKGFGDKLNIVKYIQFEYGCGLNDAGHTLNEIVTLLKTFNFTDFSRIDNYTTIPITSYDDDWKWSNIVCKNTKI